MKRELKQFAAMQVLISLFILVSYPILRAVV